MEYTFDRCRDPAVLSIAKGIIQRRGRTLRRCGRGWWWRKTTTQQYTFFIRATVTLQISTRCIGRTFRGHVFFNIRRSSSHDDTVRVSVLLSFRFVVIVVAPPTSNIVVVAAIIATTSRDDRLRRTAVVETIMLFYFCCCWEHFFNLHLSKIGSTGMYQSVPYDLPSFTFFFKMKNPKKEELR